VDGSCRQSVGILGWMVGLSHGLYLYRITQNKKIIRPCPKWDLNSLYQCLWVVNYSVYLRLLSYWYHILPYLMC